MAGEVAALIGIAAYQVWVSRKVATFPAYSRRQKAAHLALVWLAPVIGAMAAHLVMYSFTADGTNPAE